MEKTDNLKTLPNARKLSGLKDSWRFRIGDYRIESRILKIENGLEITEIISIAKLSKKDEILEIYKIAYRQASYKDQKKSTLNLNKILKKIIGLPWKIANVLKYKKTKRQGDCNAHFID